jgi:4'-phosphopantetheinyl transferase
MSEEQRAANFQLEKDKGHFKIGRSGLRWVAAKYLGINPESISISSDQGKKPYIISPEISLSFNISHSGDWVIIPISDREVGVDVEYVKPNFEFRDIL